MPAQAAQNTAADYSANATLHESNQSQAFSLIAADYKATAAVPSEKIGAAIHPRDLVYDFRFHKGVPQRLRPRDFLQLPSPQALRCNSIPIHMLPEEFS
jgi:hypothetical protein